MHIVHLPRPIIVMIALPALFVAGLVVIATLSPAIASPQAQVQEADLPRTGKAGADANNSLELASSSPESESLESLDVTAAASERGTRLVFKSTILVGSFTVFALAIFVGFEVITKVPPTLHTPLMSGSNAISGITIVGAILTAGHAAGDFAQHFGCVLGLLAVVLAMINVVGGFLVTHRMLMMFKKR